jgi:transposase
LAIDADLPPDHLARHMAQLVEGLDLQPLSHTDSGRGSWPHRPDWLLKVVLYDMQRGRHRPSQWAADFLDSRSVSWLALGLRVSRSRCYAFRDRLAPLLDQWPQEVLQQAIELGLPEATRSALDGSSVAAQASRHKLLNSATVEKRLAT